MSIFNSLRAKAAETVKTAVSSSGNKTYTVTLEKLPESLEELKAMPQASLKKPEETAALAVAALCVYPFNKEASLDMLDYLKGPQPLSPYEKQFIADRFMDKDYVPRSYFAGATPDNNYIPNEPLVIKFTENQYSRNDEGYLNLWVSSSGADSPRNIKLRNKPSTGEWFLWEQMILSGIRVPKAQDPWA